LSKTFLVSTTSLPPIRLWVERLPWVHSTTHALTPSSQAHSQSPTWNICHNSISLLPYILWSLILTAPCNTRHLLTFPDSKLFRLADKLKFVFMFSAVLQGLYRSRQTVRKWVW